MSDLCNTCTSIWRPKRLTQDGEQILSSISLNFTSEYSMQHFLATKPIKVGKGASCLYILLYYLLLFSFNCIVSVMEHVRTYIFYKALLVTAIQIKILSLSFHCPFLTAELYQLNTAMEFLEYKQSLFVLRDSRKT